VKGRRSAPSEPTEDSLAALQAEVAAFNRERAWRQFHAPKNLAMALAIEAAELMEPFRWQTPAASWKSARTGPTAEYVRDELADVLLLTLSMAEYLDIDLLAAARAKLAKNRARYPAERARGRADKYTAYASADGETPSPPAEPRPSARSKRRAAR
jgi:NTP pyrophosphatase (non-canonical NTP hydrolase)